MWNISITVLLAMCVSFTRQSEMNFANFTSVNTHMHIDTHIPAPSERQKGMAGLTDQFPISPSHPVVIRSSYTWRETWIPLGFISSNYPLLPTHAVPLRTIHYLSSQSRHCPFLPLSSSFFPCVDGSFICCVSLHLPATDMLLKVTLTCQESQAFTHTHILVVFLLNLRMNGPIQLLSSSAEECTPPPPAHTETYLFSYTSFFLQ